MRAILLVLILIVIAAIALVASGLVDINTIRGAQAPKVEANERGIAASGGQTPAFDVETGSVAVGTGQTNVSVPKVTLERGQAQVPVPKVEIRRPEDQTVNQAASNTAR